MLLMSTVLPEPLRPIIMLISPGRKVADMSSSTGLRRRTCICVRSVSQVGDLGDYKVHHQYHYRTHHHGLGAGTPHFERVPFGVIAVEAGDGGDDECIYNHLYQRIDDGEESEIHFDAGDVRVRDDDSRDQRDGVSPR